MPDPFSDVPKYRAPEPDDVLAVLNAIDSGSVTVARAPDADVGDVVVYVASNGWLFRILDDVGGWDYVDGFRRPGGDWVDPWAFKGDDDCVVDEWLRVCYWSPTNPEKTWGWGSNGESPAGYHIPPVVSA